TTANPFAYRKSMELLSEIMNGNVLIFCLYGSKQERMKNNIRPWNRDKIAFLISEE
ncbi:42597_t:CDS:1, partial [Gigaspora margarita]